MPPVSPLNARNLEAWDGQRPRLADAIDTKDDHLESLRSMRLPPLKTHKEHDLSVQILPFLQLPEDLEKWQTIKVQPRVITKRAHRSR